MDKRDDGIVILEQEETIPVKKAEKSKPLAKVFSNPATVPLGNYFTRKRIEGYAKVINAETGLMSALREHELTRGKLKNIGKEIELEELDLQNSLTNARRKVSLSSKEDYLANVEMDVKIADAEKRLAELKKPAQDDKLEPEKSKEQREIDDMVVKIKFEMEKGQLLDDVHSKYEEEIRKKHSDDPDRLRQELNRLKQIFNQVKFKM